MSNARPPIGGVCAEAFPASIAKARNEAQAGKQGFFSFKGSFRNAP